MVSEAGTVTLVEMERREAIAGNYAHLIDHWWKEIQ